MTDDEAYEVNEYMDMLSDEHERLAVAARAMLAALKDLSRFTGPSAELTTKASRAAIWEAAYAAIAQAEAAGIR